MSYSLCDTVVQRIGDLRWLQSGVGHWFRSEVDRARLQLGKQSIGDVEVSITQDRARFPMSITGKGEPWALGSGPSARLRNLPRSPATR